MPALVVGDRNHDPKTQRKEHFCSRVDATSGTSAPEAAVLYYVVGPFDSCPVVVRLVQGRSFQLNGLAVFGDSIFDPLLDVFRAVSASRVVRSDWHDHLLAAGVVPVVPYNPRNTDDPKDIEYRVQDRI